MCIRDSPHTTLSVFIPAITVSHASSPARCPSTVLGLARGESLGQEVSGSSRSSQSAQGSWLMAEGVQGSWFEQRASSHLLLPGRLLDRCCLRRPAATPHPLSTHLFPSALTSSALSPLLRTSAPLHSPPLPSALTPSHEHSLSLCHALQTHAPPSLPSKLDPRLPCTPSAHVPLTPSGSLPLHRRGPLPQQRARMRE
eukprot:2004639-Rhodomonas_salina.1